MRMQLRVTSSNAQLNPQILILKFSNVITSSRTASTMWR
jgi:hypothetical protein